MGREDKTSWKAGYFVKLIVILNIVIRCMQYLTMFLFIV